jgi:bifunctional non-homologous end joining protein LigD
MALPVISPMPLKRVREAFDHPDWLYEIKHDGFRCLAYIEDRQCRLMSRRANVFKRFTGLVHSLPSEVRARDAILDREIICLAPDGRSIFNRLFTTRARPHFAVFDVLWLNGTDLRDQPLRERKLHLRRLIRNDARHIVYVDHVRRRGVDLFALACQNDLEGIVAKRAAGPYVSHKRVTNEIKIKNPNYRQTTDRGEWMNRPR